MSRKARDTAPLTRLEIRLTQADKDTITKQAETCHLTVTEFLLRAALKRAINTSNTAGLIVELSRLAAQQKEIAGHDRRNEHRYQEILDAIVTAIQAIPHRIATKQRNQGASPWKTHD